MLLQGTEQDAPEGELGPLPKASWDDGCAVCGGNNGTLILCDGCEGEYHLVRCRSNPFTFKMVDLDPRGARCTQQPPEVAQEP